MVWKSILNNGNHGFTVENRNVIFMKDDFK